jgi:hypothetical protein
LRLGWPFGSMANPAVERKRDIVDTVSLPSILPASSQNRRRLNCRLMDLLPVLLWRVVLFIAACLIPRPAYSSSQSQRTANGPTTYGSMASSRHMSNVVFTATRVPFCRSNRLFNALRFRCAVCVCATKLQVTLESFELRQSRSNQLRLPKCQRRSRRLRNVC